MVQTLIFTLSHALHSLLFLLEIYGRNKLVVICLWKHILLGSNHKHESYQNVWEKANRNLFRPSTIKKLVEKNHLNWLWLSSVQYGSMSSMQSIVIQYSVINYKS